MTSLCACIIRIVSYSWASLGDVCVAIGCYHEEPWRGWRPNSNRSSAVFLAVMALLVACSGPSRDNTIDADVATYLDQVGQLKDDDIGVSTLLRKDMEKSDRAVTLRNLQSASSELADVVYTMRQITPPRDLVRFHTLMLDAWITHKNYVDATNQYLSSGGGLDEVNRLFGSYVLHRRDAFAEMNRFAQAYGLAYRYLDPDQG